MQILLHAQVQVDINSGNPVFPFPQFLNFNFGTDSLFTLGTKPPEGVSHAEMEQTIRDAYQIMANNFNYTEEEYAGVKYIEFDICDINCSQSDGFALIAAAYMGDKTTFDGLWFLTHDKKMTGQKKYSDCSDITPVGDPKYGTNILYEEDSICYSDGNFDIALALYVAYMQWGEHSGITDACGNEISYKKECLILLQGLTDTLYLEEYDGYLSGVIGIDGYVKTSSDWAELSDWAESTEIKPALPGTKNQMVNYSAPAYFLEFADLLQTEDPEKYAWNINQYKRSNASSAWQIRQHYLSDSRAIPLASEISLAGSSPQFFNTDPKEDSRWALKNAMDYMWHGNPSVTWNPETHQLEAGGNSYQKDMALRYASFLKNPQGDPWNNPCETIDSMNIYKGIETLVNDYTMYGEQQTTIHSNLIPGTGSTAAIVAQDYELMAMLFRQCELMWEGSDGYLESVPKDFDGWNRFLGMLLVTGNFQAPSAMKPQPNLRTYVSVDKTTALRNETITFTIDFRNYGSVAATNTSVVFSLPKGVLFITATNGGIYNESSRTVTWNIGSLPGYSNKESFENTKGSVQLTIQTTENSPETIIPKAFISCSNGKTSESDNFPNIISSTYSRNSVDLIKEALTISKKVSSDSVFIATPVSYTISFRANTMKELTGGRPNVSYMIANETDNINYNPLVFEYKIIHHAQESYINSSNYRFSYFYNAPEDVIYLNWISELEANGHNRENTTFSFQNLPSGNNDSGIWNKRTVVQYKSNDNAPTKFLARYQNTANIRKGETAPFISVLMQNNKNLQEDWSIPSLHPENANSILYPISPNYSNTASDTDCWDKDLCEQPSEFAENILVEEFDGYTWRKIAGNAPPQADSIKDVMIADSIPQGFEFLEFTGALPLGIEPTYSDGIITWKASSIPKDTTFEISYTVQATNNVKEDTLYSSVAYITDETEVIVTSRSDITVLIAEDTLTIITDTVKNETITNAYDGEISIHVEGGLPPYSIEWNTNDTTEYLSELHAGLYSVTVTDSLLHQTTKTFKITVEEGILPLSIGYVTFNEAYQNAGDGAIDITVNGGVEPYLYFWSNDSTTEDLINLISGNYSVTVIDNMNDSISMDFKINPYFILSEMEIIYEITNETDVDMYDGKIDVRIRGGLPSFKFEWNTGDTTNIISNIPHGVYSVTVTDIRNVSTADTFYVGLENTPLSAHGTVSSQVGAVTSGKVLLFKKQNNTSKPYSSTSIQEDGSFRFDTLPKGIYYIYAIPSPEIYTYIYPSYYGESTNWKNAYEINLQGFAKGIDIVLQELSPISLGSGSISGTLDVFLNAYEENFYAQLFYPDESVAQNKAKNIVVYLMQNNEIFGWTLTNGNGEYAFNNIPYGKYSIVVEKPNTYPNTKEILLNENQPYSSNIDFTLEEDVYIPFKKATTIYPNPTNNIIYIAIADIKKIQVYNSEGKLVLQNSGKNSIQLKHLTHGLYTIKTITGESVFYNCILKN